MTALYMENIGVMLSRIIVHMFQIDRREIEFRAVDHMGNG